MSDQKANEESVKYRRESFVELVSLVKTTDRLFYLVPSDERISRRLRVIRGRLLKIVDQKGVALKRAHYLKAKESIDILEKECVKDINCEYQNRKLKIEIFCKNIVRIFAEIKDFDSLE